ncbi:MAG: nucleotidyltransferase family protein [Pseudomonadota bacterium]
MGGELMDDAPNTAMVLAAGFGTRMGALTADRPKPLLTVGGKTLLDRALDECAAAGVSRAVVNLHYLGDMIRKALHERVMPAIVFSEETEILETGGGVANASPLLGEAPFFTMNADAVWTGMRPLPQLSSDWRDGIDALLLLAPVERAIGYTRAGDFFAGDDGGLTRRGDKARAPYVYTGAQIIRPEAFADAPDGAFSLNVIWDRLIAEGRIGAVVHDGEWVDVGTPDGLCLAERAVSA